MLPRLFQKLFIKNRTILKLIRGGTSQQSFENRLFNGITFYVAIFAFFILLPVNYAIGRSQTDLLVLFLVGIVSLCFYTVSIYKNIQLVVSTFFSHLAFLTYFWFTGAGSKGPQPLFYIATFIAAIILLRGWQRTLWSFLIPLYLISLMTVEYLHPEFIRYYANQSDQIADSITGTIAVFIITATIIRIVVNHFDAERKVTQIQSRKLRLRNLKLSELAIKDGLTGLYNRRHLMDQLSREIAHAKRYNHPLAIILFDIDFFKNINDTFGHQAGDSILKQVGQSLLANLRQSDFAGRYGGEEFLIICRNTNVEGAFMVAKKLQHSIRHIELPNKQGCVEISGGISTHRDDTIASLIERADQLLYSAKERGRNQILIDKWEKSF